jgi:hypothetical protein
MPCRARKSSLQLCRYLADGLQHSIAPARRRSAVTRDRAQQDRPAAFLLAAAPPPWFRLWRTPSRCVIAALNNPLIEVVRFLLPSAVSLTAEVLSLALVASIPLPFVSRSCPPGLGVP